MKTVLIFYLKVTNASQIKINVSCKGLKIYMPLKSIYIEQLETPYQIYFIILMPETVLMEIGNCGFKITNLPSWSLLCYIYSSHLRQHGWRALLLLLLIGVASFTT